MRRLQRCMAARLPTPCTHKEHSRIVQQRENASCCGGGATGTCNARQRNHINHNKVHGLCRNIWISTSTGVVVAQTLIRQTRLSQVLGHRILLIIWHIPVVAEASRTKTHGSLTTWCWPASRRLGTSNGGDIRRGSRSFWHEVNFGS